MNEQRLQQSGITLLRVSLGIVLIAHSVYLKMMVFTLPGTAQFFTSLGLPGFLAYVVFALEALGGIALILGVQVRWVSLALVPVLLGATWAHLPAGWLFSNPNGGWEYPAFLTVAAVAQALLGDGAGALQKSASVRGLQPA
ncbi:DoxX family protein [Exilibacterium tricleocarpae]|uniref:DoxX family protein n=1 Tax=Exilibacterium tricleocarpae TaxID=2591008 RepID=A0A545T1Q2_9GAMM|nr:DoxX family protein [Exilibacterium tricleocarpae]TQV71144.1 DoxX family protein [Exilibacterium tricleocarpae]